MSEERIERGSAGRWLKGNDRDVTEEIGGEPTQLMPGIARVRDKEDLTGQAQLAAWPNATAGMIGTGKEEKIAFGKPSQGPALLVFFRSESQRRRSIGTGKAHLRLAVNFGAE